MTREKLKKREMMQNVLQSGVLFLHQPMTSCWYWCVEIKLKIVLHVAKVKETQIN